MLRESYTAVVDRNEIWQGAAASEPYECGWAGEAIVWLRVLGIEGNPAPATARVQISPDGIRWLDEGSTFAVPMAVDGIAFARVGRFGNWLRLAADLPAGTSLKVLVTMTLKA